VSTDVVYFIKLLLILALVLGFGFWELWKLTKDKEK
jgi:hypothetical protein